MKKLGKNLSETSIFTDSNQGTFSGSRFETLFAIGSLGSEGQ